ncbi:MAG: hypothetical protein K9N35_03930 [Candidatus Marinimicrobia bacterium]|nr:hypothetical protein [Candidatus Neomarinimicrobiota bacterium]
MPYYQTCANQDMGETHLGKTPLIKIILWNGLNMVFCMRPILILIVALIAASSINAQWPTTPDSMYVPPVGNLPGNVSPTIMLPVADKENGLFLSHTDGGYGIQHMGMNGELLWGQSGVNVHPIQHDYPYLMDLEPGPNGSLYVLYVDTEIWWDETLYYRPYFCLTHFDKYGQLSWNEPFRLAADSVNANLINPKMGDLIHDPSAEGVFIHWRDFDSTTFYYKDKIQYIHNKGSYPEEQYQQNGIWLDAPDKGIPHLWLSEVKGIFINENLSFDVFVSASDTALYFQKYDATGDPILVGPGVKVSPDIFSFKNQTVRPQRYKDDLYIVTKGAKLQIVNSNGIDQLSQAEVEAIGSVARAIVPKDGENAEFFTWSARLDSITNEFALIYQWYDSNLNKQYGPDGITIDTLDGFNWRHLYYTPGPDNSVYVCRTFQNDKRLYAQRFNRDGSMWSDWKLLHSKEWHHIWEDFTYTVVTTDGSFIVPIYNGSEIGLVRIRPDGSLGAPVGIKPDDLIPRQFKLGAPYPNPFNSSLAFQYQLNTFDLIHTDAFDLKGRHILSANHNGKPGSNRLTIDFSSVERPSGVYLISVWLASNPELKQVVKATYMK